MRSATSVAGVAGRRIEQPVGLLLHEVERLAVAPGWRAIVLMPNCLGDAPLLSLASRWPIGEEAQSLLSHDAVRVLRLLDRRLAPGESAAQRVDAEYHGVDT